MHIDVFDTYAKSKNGNIMHFDVLVDRGTVKELALGYAKSWLLGIGETTYEVEQSNCNFCHSEKANAQIQQSIETHGHFILQLDGCPKPTKF